MHFPNVYPRNRKIDNLVLLTYLKCFLKPNNEKIFVSIMNYSVPFPANTTTVLYNGNPATTIYVEVTDFMEIFIIFFNFFFTPKNFES